jgi:hypothetical protein
MRWIVAYMKGIMIVCGLLTCTMLYAAIAPQAALQATFGSSLEGPLAEVVVRNWGVLIALVGAMLLYGAYVPAARPLVLIVAGTSKIVFMSLLLTIGRPFLGQATIAIVSDVIQVALFAAYLFLTRART